MRDWKEFVSVRLEMRELVASRRDRIVRELAEHLEEVYLERREQGDDHATADLFAREYVTDWEQIANGFANTEKDQRVSWAERRTRQVEYLFTGRGWPGGSFVRDLRQSVRGLARNPGTTTVAVLTVALGIGAMTSIFAVFDGVLLRPLPYQDPEALVMLRIDAEGLDSYPGLSRVEVEGFQKEGRSFEDLGRLVAFTTGLTAAGDMEQVPAVTMSSEVLPILRVEPLLGRNFGPEDRFEEAGGFTSVMISHRLWHRRFGADPEIVGKPIEIDNRARTIVAVLPAEFRLLLGPGTHVPPLNDIFVPPSSSPNFQHMHIWRTIARLRPMVSSAEAQAEATEIGNRVIGRYPDAYGSDPATIQVRSLLDDVTFDARRALAMLLVAAVFVLLVCCTNVASLQLARSRKKLRELAMRATLGASRARLLSQIVTENIVIGLLGGVLGLGLAMVGIRGLLLIAVDLPRAEEVVSIDLRIVGFTLLVSVLAGILFGSVPAWKGSRASPIDALRGSGRGVVRSGVRSCLVVGEVAISLVLLVGALLMVESLENLHRVDLGYHPEKLMSFRSAVDRNAFETPAERREHFGRVARTVAALPGVESVGAARWLPFQGDEWATGYALPGESEEQFLSRSAAYDWILPGYFESMGIPILAGSDFTTLDHENDRSVVIVDQDLAERAWPGESAIGKRLTVDMAFGRFDLQAAEVVGVVGHIRTRDLRSHGHPQLYLPYKNQSRRVSGATFVVRGGGDPQLLIRSIRTRVDELGGGRPVHSFRMLSDDLAMATGKTRFAVTLLALLALSAVILSGVGCFGVMSQTVSQRTREIGVRMALGAASHRLLLGTVGDGMKLALVGVVVGVVTSFGVTRFLEVFLFEVAATDLMTILLASGTLLGVSVAASFLPARRASRVDPMVALRLDS